MTFIFLFEICISELHSQVPASVHHADSLMKAGLYEEACLEYLRIQYESSDLEQNNLLLYRQAEALKMMGKYKNAFETLQKADFSIMPDSLHFLFRQQLSLNAYLSGDFTEAISQITQCRFFLQDTAYYKSLLPVLILSLNELSKYQEAKAAALEYASWLELNDTNCQSFREKINELYTKKNLPSIKNPDRAETMSAILPGLGHIYAGYPEEGILSFTIIAGSLTAGIYGIFKKYYFTGYFIGLSMFQKFYFGGIRRAHQLAEKHNALKTEAFNLRIRQLLFQ
ncbi:MAG TPA: hypothetical protein P5265_11830 [Bacteroidia bacterium]|nr:hypothetical protein [Bacteroidia bacterium]HRU69169.1 hypothetical protein [Bacteroidia bacterium]